MVSCRIIIIFLLPLCAKSQESIHWLINQDKITDCNYIKSGKFVQEKSCDEITEDYSIEFRDDYVLEKVENGKYFLRSKITYTSNCAYQLKVLETNIPGYESEIGKIYYTEILETAKIDKLIKIRSKGDKWQTVVLRKVAE